MAKRLAELGALQDAVSNDEAAPKRLGLAGYIRGLFLDWSANPYNPLTRLSARGRLLGYFWDSGAIGLSMNFADQNYLIKDGTVKSKSFSDIVNFSRTTNATVTNSAGLITYAPHNLLVASEQFDSASWVKTSVTVSSNSTVAPNNTTTSDTITSAAANGFIYQTFSAIAGTTYTFSCYVKSVSTATTLDIALLNASGASGIANVSFTTTGDWTRVSVTGTSATTQTAWVAFGTGGSFNTGETFYAWGAQLEIGSTATTYNPTTVKNLLGFSELFDNAAWTKSNSFVQTNLLTYSEAFDNTATWTPLASSSVTANTVIAPNGYQTADTITAVNTTNQGVIGKGTGIVSGITYTESVYAKSNTSGIVQLTLSTTGFGSNIWANFDLINGVLGSTGSSTISSSITNVGNGWYKCEITGTATGAIASGQNTAVIALVDTVTTGRVGAVTIGSSVYAWGAQLVQGSVAGDYRRTDAAALPVYYPNHNGVVVAEQIQGTAANGTVLESYTASGVTMTFSIWIRRITGTGNVDITMDTGVTWTTQAITTSWARYSITTTPASGARTAGIRLVTSGDVIQVFGAQVSPSASLDPYVLNAGAAPTAAAYYGARFDYDPVTLAPKGLLIEEQRANLLLNSSLAGTNLATQSVTVTAVAHTLSFYGTGTVTLTGTANTSLVGTGAYPTRSTLTFTPTAGVVLFTVTGTVQFAQLEIGSFATSFIPTGASQVTRAADVATIQGSNFFSWYNQNEGSFTVSPTNIATTGNRIPWEVNDNTANNRVRVFINTTTSTWTLQATSSGVAGPASTPSVALQTVKIASGLKSFDFAQVVNTALVSNTTALIPVISTQLQIGIGQTGAGSQFNGTIKQISYYPQRLSNDVLKGLTA